MEGIDTPGVLPFAKHLRMPPHGWVSWCPLKTFPSRGTNTKTNTHTPGIALATINKNECEKVPNPLKSPALNCLKATRSGETGELAGLKASLANLRDSVALFWLAPFLT